MEQITFETAKTTYMTEVTSAYENMRRLYNICDETHNNTGDTFAIPVGESIEMSESGFGAGNIPISTLGATQIIVKPGNFSAKTIIGGGERTLFAYDKIAYHAEEHGKAAGRWYDKLILDAIYNDGAGIARFAQIAKTVGFNTGLNVDKISTAIDTMEDQGVTADKNAIIPVISKTSLKKDPLFTSWDYNVERPLMNNRVQRFLDVNFFSIGNKGANAIPFNDNAGTREYLVPVVARDAMRVVFNREIKSTMTFVENQDRYELLTVATARAVVVKNDGIILMACDAPATLNALYQTQAKMQAQLQAQEFAKVLQSNVSAQKSSKGGK